MLRFRSLLVLLALAAVAPAQEATQFVFSFDKGLNLRDNGTTIATSADYMTGDSYNFEIYPGTGVLYKRPGIERLTTPTSIPVGRRIYDGGATYIDEAGVYQNGRLISDMLGSAITDSTFAAYLDSAAIVAYDRQIWIATVRNAKLDSYIWKYNERTNAWTKWKANRTAASVTAHTDSVFLAPKKWGMWTPTSDNRDRLFYSARTDTISGRRVYMIDPTQTFDDDSAGNDQRIPAQAITPAFTTPGALTTWKHALISLDANENVTVYATISKQNNDGTVSKTEKTILTLVAADGDSTPAGAIATYVAPINEDGYSCSLRIYTAGVTENAVSKSLGRCRVHPGMILAVKRQK